MIMGACNHIRFTNARGHMVPVCGKCDVPDLLLIEPHAAVTNADGGTYCLSCIQVLSELIAYRDARLRGMREPLFVRAFLAQADALMDPPANATDKGQ